MSWRFLLFGCVFLFGCGESAPKAPSGSTGTRPAARQQAASQQKPAAKPAVEHVVTDHLPLGTYLPPLDDERIEIAIPAGWRAFPRDRAYVARFFKTNRNGLPRIDVTVEERSFNTIETATADNVEAWARLVAAEREAEGKKKSLDPVRPMIIGKSPCLRFVSRVGLKLPEGITVNAERQRILMLRDGRLYTIDLLVLPGTLLQSRDAAHAVCASLRFVDQAIDASPGKS